MKNFASRNEFIQFFPNCTGSSLYITPQLLKGASDDTHIHSAFWKFYLLIAPNTPKQFAKDEDWIRILKEKRSEFYALKEKYFIKAPDDDSNDPLRASEDSKWSQFFIDQDLRQQIRTDTSRAFQELEYFQCQDTLQILEDILFLFCRTHPSYGYPQGLHELAAFILFVFHEEMIAEESDTISFIFNSASFIPDSYFVFAKLAEYVEPFYRAADTNSSGPNGNNNNNGNTIHIADLAEEIQNRTIERKSPELSRALQNSGIAPHSYMMKWMRLLFLSVFDFASVKSMWDIIIAHLPNLDVVKNTCAAMLLNAQKKLISCDSTEALQFLFHYPSVPKPARFVVEAVEMAKSKGRIGNNKNSGSRAASNSGNHTNNSSSEDLVNVVAERLNELSRGLNEICTVNGYELAMPYVMDLRRTRDVLLGILPVEEMLPLEQAVELFKPQKVEYKPIEIESDHQTTSANSAAGRNSATDIGLIKASSTTTSNSSSSKNTTSSKKDLLLFGDSNEDDERENNKSDNCISVGTGSTTKSSVFGEDSSKDDPLLFGSSTSSTATNSTKRKLITTTKKSADLFGEDDQASRPAVEPLIPIDEPLFGVKPKEETKPQNSQQQQKKIVIAKKIMGTNSTDNLQLSSKANNDDDDDPLLSKDNSKKPQKTSTATTVKTPLFPSDTNEANNDLFAAQVNKTKTCSKAPTDNSDDILFGSKSSSSPKEGPSASLLFAEDNTSNQKKTTSKQQLQKKPAVSHEIVDDDPLFGGSSMPQSANTSQKKKIVIVKPQQQEAKPTTAPQQESEKVENDLDGEIVIKPKAKSAVSSIYDDDDDIQAFSKKNTPSPNAGSSLFGDDDDILAKPKEKKGQPKQGSLFD